MSNERAKHTPGPWSANIEKSPPDSWEPDKVVVRIESETQLIAFYDCNWGEMGTDEQIEANAHLIAAAPDMHEALDAFPSDDDYANVESYSNAVKAWWLSRVLPVLRKVDGAEA